MCTRAIKQSWHTTRVAVSTILFYFRNRLHGHLLGTKCMDSTPALLLYIYSIVIYYTLVYIYSYIHTYIAIYTYIYSYVYTHIHTYILYIAMYIYTYIHIHI